ncbi:MAG: phosphatidate cytidylyltransferase [Prevotella sp.]|nr:phosphatidate cytidylyltransferase [Prevotella sp.]MBP5507031.1 phosphatidate cytidylyltransferase [Prevotella sp.]
MTDKKQNFIVRTITGVLFVAILVTCFFRAQSMIMLFALITGLTIWEFGRLVNEWDDIQINRFISTVAGVYFFLAMAGYCTGMAASPTVFIPYLITIIYLIISELFMKAPNPVNNWAYTMLSQMYIALPLSTINLLAFQTGEEGQYNALLPLSIFIFLWVNDTGAYCVGSLIGKHKLFPRVSPGKTWEGSVGGGLLVLVAAAVIGWLTNGETASLSIPVWMGLGLVVVVFGTLGDLVESMFKRTLGVKDSGNILPGHGGMLDRFDSSLMAIPAAVVYLFTLSLF